MAWTTNGGGLPSGIFDSIPSNSPKDTTPCVSFIGIVDFSQEARWLYMTDSVTDLLGFEPKELIGRPSLELVHPDEFPRVRQLHYDTIQQDKAAVLVYLRLRHKDPYKGYILCGIVILAWHPIGSVSFASPGAKALHNASTAQEITVISKGAHNFEFRRWHDPSPMPPSPTLPPIRNLPPSPSSSAESSWSSPSPPPSTLPPPTNSSSYRSNYSNVRAESVYIERSPSPITGRPRPMRKQSSTAGTSSTVRTPETSNRDPSSPPGGPSPPRSPPYHYQEHARHSPRGSLSHPSRSRSPSPLLPTPVSDTDRSSEHIRGRSGSESDSYSTPRKEEHSGSSYQRRDSGYEYDRDYDYRDSRAGENGRGRGDPDYRHLPPPAPSSHRQQPQRPPSPPPRPSTPVITFPHLPSKSFRTAFILDRFSLHCTILYCSNDLMVQSTHAIGRSFFDFVALKDEGIVKSWIECVKGWGVNERGQPSDGGFGFGRFNLLVCGRESVPRLPDPSTPSRHRQGSTTTRHHSSRHRHGPRTERERERDSAYAAYQRELGEQFPVDAIFSAHSDGLMVILRRAQT
ncbi:hypothetical protein CC1G_03335 [Coprinopsis cinerea okayama7|uniref:PAS domain-containing protein n=1 Tax=Coprinopsis cinerea (strain Okayama-7 / 130 / ATCC MYA-4618 / FGSC 9003) TaxID=240176 RepID=A8NQV6_COPC7|nr:hypothetical protein CC1G_03335 [Coprinopsis cinerea okayama7\|eukprot:XP_001835553.2 hypothetical protein CC1G_03335 [Coprinopsis cinerea okayama7\